VTKRETPHLADTRRPNETAPQYAPGDEQEQTPHVPGMGQGHGQPAILAAYKAERCAEEFALALLANPRLEQIIGITRTDPLALAQTLHDYCYRAASAWLAAQSEIGQ
jgi:hypothetical protein